MRKIGGVKMDTTIRLTGMINNHSRERHSSIYKAIEESLKEVKLIKEGKLKPKTWRQVLEELEEINEDRK